jgi:tetratricopeptide (TPR) repeat protein
VTIAAADTVAPAIETVQPWPGLDTFTETLSRFFCGRDTEADELFRHVQREVVTVLFGQSGLGKTSLLQAGLFPRLREAGFLPILIRLDYSAGAPPLVAQVKGAIERECTASNFSEATWSTAEASLWSCFHRADRRLTDRAGKEILPVLVFDEFEEIFTQGLASSEGRAGSQSFLTELAELMENRPPEALEQAIEADPKIAEGFRFDRRDYRIVLALREDFLAALEGLRARAPSLGRNRYRLRAMTGAQGLNAILGPAPGLVEYDVAKEIIRFVGRASPEVAFGTSNAGDGFEVEPSLLSLVCRELNERRLAQGLDEINADLLAGSRDDIIERFYERCFADQSPALRAFVEDELLSASGFRESITLDTAQRVLADNCVPAGALDELVRRRLLRIEERSDIARVEIIHDVLTPVIRRSRETRRLRQAEAAAAAREAALHRERKRARQAYWFAAAMTLLAIATIGLFCWGWSSKLEAERQRAFAEQERAAAEQQRSAAEEQRTAAAAETKRAEQNFDIAVLTADALVTGVAERLRLSGGMPVKIVRDILITAERSFDGLAAAKTNSSDLHWRRALLLVSFAYTYQTLGESLEALGRATAARDAMLELVKEDPENTRWEAALAVSYRTLGDILCNGEASCQGHLSAALAQYRADLEIMKDLAEKESGNLDWQEELAHAHSGIGHVLVAQGNLADALTEYSVALDIDQRLTEMDSGNRKWQHNLATAHQYLGNLDRAWNDLPRALTEYRKEFSITQRLVEADPGNEQWQRDLSNSHNDIGDVLRAQRDFNAALVEYNAELDTARRLIAKDPGNAQWENDASVIHQRIGDVFNGRLELAKALAEYRAGLAIQQGLAEKDSSNGKWQRNLAIFHLRVGDSLSNQGDLTASLAEYGAALDIVQTLIEKDSESALWHRDLLLVLERFGLVGLQRNDFQAALKAFEKAEKIAVRVKDLNPTAATSVEDLAWVEAQLEETRRKVTEAGPADGRQQRPIQVPSRTDRKGLSTPGAPLR